MRAVEWEFLVGVFNEGVHIVGDLVGCPEYQRRNGVIEALMEETRDGAGSKFDSSKPPVLQCVRFTTRYWHLLLSSSLRLMTSSSYNVPLCRVHYAKMHVSDRR